MEIIASIIVAIITGGLTLLGVIYSSRKQHDSTIEEIKRQNDVTITQIKGDIRLIQADISELEKKQDKHNSVIERMYLAERNIDVLTERQQVANHRIEDLEKLSQK